MLCLCILWFHFWAHDIGFNRFISLTQAAQGNKSQGSFIKKDDPKVAALTQQAELLSSLALTVNSENTDQSLENAWKVSNIMATLSINYS